MALVPPLTGNEVSPRVAATKVPLVIATAGTPTQIYRNTDYKFFVLKKLHIHNPHGSDFQELKVLDYDLTDTEGDKDITKYLYPVIRVAPNETVILTEEELGWLFRYGMAAYVTTSNGLEVYPEGIEVP